ncbi:MAG: transporter [Bacteroidota bacterium]|jgi:lipopolysaccharide transport system ATP-binding protein|nr:transporter [Bacteroidota bacterium]
MSEVLIKAEHVSKKFSKDLKKSLYFGLLDVFSGVMGSSKKRELRGDEFWAVKDISFEVKRGECLGLIGHNGAGKSTLLKMLNGLISPDTGNITMYGKVGALIELGAGFNPILTGRENIYNNAAVIGFNKKEIDAKFDSIVEFSEIGDFLDMPVQNYSSGMKVRLGFAIAAQMEPDILIVDEVLAVGDLGFKIKCMNRIQELLKNTAVIFVTHAMTQISNVCTRLILMNKGQVEFSGTEIGEGIEKYFLNFSSSEQKVISSKNVFLKNVDLHSGNSGGGTELSINSGDPLTVSFELEVEEEIKNLRFRIGIFNMEYRLLAEVDSDQVRFIAKNRPGGKVRVSVDIENLFLRFGKYTIHLHVTDKDKNAKVLRMSDIAVFTVKPTLSVGADFLMPSKWQQLE